MCVVNNVMKEEINWSVSWQVQVQQMGGVTMSFLHKFIVCLRKSAEIC